MSITSPTVKSVDQDEPVQEQQEQAQEDQAEVPVIGEDTQGDLYQVLGLSHEASLSEIKKQYRKLSLLYHPDKKTGDEEKFAAINTAYKVLANTKRRKKYDAALSSTFEDIRGAERDFEYHRNNDFIKKDDTTGEERFNHQKFMQEFERKNETVAGAATVKSFEQEGINYRHVLAARMAERDQFMTNLHENVQEASHLLKEQTQGDPTAFNAAFNSIFDDLKKKNKEVVEAGSCQQMEMMDGMGRADLGFDQSINWFNQAGSELGGGTQYMAYESSGFGQASVGGMSAWQPEQTGVVTSGDGLNLHQPGFNDRSEMKDMINEGVRVAKEDPDANTDPEWRQPAADELLKARMAAYEEQTKQYQSVDVEAAPTFFKVQHNDDLLHHDEVKSDVDPEEEDVVVAEEIPSKVI